MDTSNFESVNTVGELIEFLQNFDPDREVVLQAPSDGKKYGALLDAQSCTNRNYDGTEEVFPDEDAPDGHLTPDDAADAVLLRTY